MRLLFCLFFLLPFSAAAGPRVLVSIEPLFQITSIIMQDVAEPRLLIKDMASTHYFAFKPSHLRQLEEADLVIWIDRYFESGFQKLPQIMRRNTEGLELLRVLGLETSNGHIWYSPTLLLQIIDQIQSALGRIDPQNTTIYSKNARQLSQLIKNWDAATREQLANAKPQYLLDHDFLSQLERDIGIQAIAILHDANEQPPSIRELKRIEDNIAQSSAKCLLTNEPSPSKLALSIAQKFKLPIYNITPAADAGTAASAGAAAAFIRSLNLLSSTLLKCS